MRLSSTVFQLTLTIGIVFVLACSQGPSTQTLLRRTQQQGLKFEDRATDGEQGGDGKNETKTESNPCLDLVDSMQRPMLEALGALSPDQIQGLVQGLMPAGADEIPEDLLPSNLVNLIPGNFPKIEDLLTAANAGSSDVLGQVRQSLDCMKSIFCAGDDEDSHPNSDAAARNEVESVRRTVLPLLIAVGGTVTQTLQKCIEADANTRPECFRHATTQAMEQLPFFSMLLQNSDVGSIIQSRMGDFVTCATKNEME